MIDRIRDSQWLYRRIQHRLIHPMHKYVYPTYNGVFDVLDADWDSLIILDGCRADLFEERADLSIFDTYRSVKSTGSDSQEWIQRTFDNKSFGDIVYVTANPHVTKLVSNSFHAVIDVWEDGFNEQLQTIPPSVVKDAARQAHNQYPNKRLIVHFMQPHHPFIDADIAQFGAPAERTAETDENGPCHVWDALRRGVVSKEVVWQAYGDNLELVFDEMKELLSEFDGKTVVTADHGNALGERAWPVPIRLYGHPGGIRMPALTDVPWATVENTPRRTVRDDGVSSAIEYNENLIEDRLTDLGYLPDDEN